MPMKNTFCKKRALIAGIVLSCSFGLSQAAISPTEVVTLPSDAKLGGGDAVGSTLSRSTYNGGKGPGIWIVADGGYRLYHNGALLAEDNQAGRVRFVPMTFLPGENAISVIGVDEDGAHGVMVQIDELHESYYSGGTGWYAKPDYGIYNNAWKNKGRDLSQWGGATTLSYSNTKMPNGADLTGWPSGSQSKWIWTGSSTDTTVALLYNLNITAEGFGASTTGGDAGSIVIASDSASIRKYLQSSEAVTILVPEGTYDFRQFRDAVTEATAAGRTWCKSTCGANDKNSSNTFYRINFAANTCSGLDGTTIVGTGEIQSWDNWITIKNNKSLIGMGRGANLRGASLNNRKNEGAGNNIFRNLAIYDVNPHLIEAGDGLEISGNNGNEVSNFWFDHISYKWISDGMDLEFVKGLTVSYVDYDGANEYNCYYYDPYMHLVENAQATIHDMYWHNSFGRVPKIYAKDGSSVAPTVHIYNSYVDYNHWHIIDVNGTSSLTSQLLYENNYIGTANIQVAGKDAYSKVNMKNNTIKKAKSSTPYSNNGTATSTAFTDNVFTPSYSYTLRTNSTLPDSMPLLTGVGGRYGSMPSYNQATGISPIASTVSVSATPAQNAVTLSATVKSNSGSAITKVDFYIGTTLVGSATSSPYMTTVSDVSAGTYSAIAIATDKNGLEGVSSYTTFEVSGEAVLTKATLTKNGAGSSNQTITLGESIASFSYVWGNCSGVEVTGLPNGVNYTLNEFESRVTISGTPTEAGAFTYTIATVGADTNVSVVRKITVNDPNASSSSVAAESSSSETATSSATAESSSSAEESTVISGNVNYVLEATTYYRIFDMQGRPLFSGAQKPNQMPADRVIVIEYTKSGSINRRYIQAQ